MRLTPDELKKHNDKVLRIAKLKCEQSQIPGLTVSYPDFVKGDNSKVQLALPCGVIRDKKRKVNAMQVRTGAFTISLAKECTKYDAEIGEEYNDETDYMPFDFATISADGGEILSKKAPIPVATPSTYSPTAKGILDL